MQNKEFAEPFMQNTFFKRLYNLKNAFYCLHILHLQN